MKKYKALLPLKTDVTVKEQFGWLPMSVIKPNKGSAWNQLIGDDGDKAGTRRSKGCKYLPNLRFSKFNPHLAETIIKYWSIEGQTILDPFAGRATRGVISVVLGRNYIGYEIIKEVADDTRQHILSANGSGFAKIYNDDGCLLGNTEDEVADLVFTCPPYHRQERYVSCLGQLSDIKDYADFLVVINSAADNIIRVLKSGGFLVWVCADWRDGKAFRLFHKDSLDIFISKGLTCHDIMIIENISPFAPLQAGKVAAKRYTSKVHEYALVFRK